eukprot:549092-Rhodomonas_salina.2
MNVTCQLGVPPRAPVREYFVRECCARHHADALEVGWAITARDDAGHGLAPLLLTVGFSPFLEGREEREEREERAAAGEREERVQRVPTTISQVSQSGLRVWESSLLEFTACLRVRWAGLNQGR